MHGAFPKIDRWSSGSHIRERTLPDRRSHYKEKKLEPRLNEAKEGKRAVFFVDAAHFVMGAFLGFVWCFERLFVKSPSGRKRFNVLGALNAITHEVILVTNDTYITATQVCELLEKIAALGLMIPINLVLDNDLLIPEGNIYFSKYRKVINKRSAIVVC